MLGEVSYQLGHAIEFRNVTPNLHYESSSTYYLK